MTKFLLDPGHGGLAFGHYLTPGKRSPEVPPGIFEGDFNRRVCKLIEQYDPEQYLNIAPGPIQIPLKARVDFVNKLAKLEDCVLISVHANAAPGVGWTSANGFTVFISKGASVRSERLASMIHDEFIGITESRGIKRESFTIIKQVTCPAVLVECGFMTNRIDAEFMASDVGQKTFAAAIHDACERFKHA